MCENKDFIDTRPPPTGTPSNLEGELWLLLNLMHLRVESEQKQGTSNWTAYIKVEIIEEI